MLYNEYALVLVKEEGGAGKRIRGQGLPTPSVPTNIPNTSASLAF